MSFKNFLCLVLLCLLAVPALVHAQARQGATALVEAHKEKVNEVNTQLGGGSDLKALASPKKNATSFTGFPAGTLPGSSAAPQPTAEEAPKIISPTGRIVLSGSPIESVLSSLPVGSPLDKICSLADHMGYRVSPLRYSGSTFDTPYSCVLSQGRKKIATLHLNRSLKLSAVQ